MKTPFLLASIVILSIFSSANSATILGKVTTYDQPNGAPAADVSLYQSDKPTGLGASTNLDGNYKITNIPKGVYIIHFDYIGYESTTRTVVLSDDNSVETVNVNLSSSAISGKEVVVTASITKHEVSVSNTPLRVEVMVPEEVQDKIAFTTTVDGALKYSGGIVVNTSKNIYEAENIRLRGMDSRYLLLLQNRAPVIGFQPDEVGLWAIPLIGIKQIEVVKGDHSALYGFGNSGIISAVMRNPFNDTINVFALMRTNFEDDHYVGMYAGKKVGRFGFSGIFSGEVLGESDSTNLRNIIEPRIDYHSKKTNAFISADILGLNSADKNLFQRFGLHTRFETPISSKTKFSVQGQFANQKRNYTLSDGHFDANTQIAHEIFQFSRSVGKFTTIAGTDGYLENWSMVEDSIDYSSKIGKIGIFFQIEHTINQKLSFLYVGRSSGNYIDYSTKCEDNIQNCHITDGSSSNFLWGTNHLFSLLFKPKYNLSFRFSGSYGTASPKSHYVYYSEDTSFVAIPQSNLKMEQFWGTNLDIKIVKDFGLFSGTMNISAFATSIKNRIDIFYNDDATSSDGYHLTNCSSSYDIFGTEFFSRFDFGDDASLLCGYSYFLPNNKYEHDPGTMLPLPHHQANIELDWEIESTGIRMEIEGKALSGNKLVDNPYRNNSPPYTVFGGTFEYTLWKLKIFAGAENIFNFRQTDAGPLWGPREGRELYLGVKTAL